MRLLRPVAVLCALHLYRFGFASAPRPIAAASNRVNGTGLDCVQRPFRKHSQFLAVVSKTLRAFEPHNQPKPCTLIHAVGTVVEQVAADEEAQNAAEARRLENQRGSAALLKRFFVLHGGKVVAFTVWWAAIQRPGAIGWLLTGTVDQRAVLQFYIL